jgi:hypothetical protein
MFVAGRFVAMSKYFLYSVNISRRTSDNLWQQDNKLAHKGIPLSKGYYEYFLGDSITGKVKVEFDSLGFRGVMKTNNINSDTLNLFLGCSWTFGDYIIAEEGYPYKLSKLLNQNFINTGASAYGLAQMIQLLDSLIPKHSFNYAFIQLSPWLANRAMSFIGPTAYGYRPFPYFSESNNAFFLEYTPYRVKKKRSDWRLKNKFIDKLNFYITTGFEEEIFNYMNYKIAILKSEIGLLNKPTTNKNKLEIYFYNYVINKCKEYNVKPVIIKVRYENIMFENPYLIQYFKEKNITVVDLDVALENDTTDIKNKRRYEIYHELANGEKVYYDDHPNSLANSIYSNAIFNSLNK